MGLFDSFPYTNFHNLNLDWILEELRRIDSGDTDIRARLNLLQAQIDGLRESIEEITAKLDTLDIPDPVEITWTADTALEDNDGGLLTEDTFSRGSALIMGIHAGYKVATISVAASDRLSGYGFGYTDNGLVQAVITGMTGSGEQIQTQIALVKSADANDTFSYTVGDLTGVNDPALLLCVPDDLTPVIYKV